jgi:hypothetical protein
MARTKKTLRIGVGSAKRAKPAGGSRKPPTQWGKSKTLPDPDDNDADDVELRCGRSKTEKEKESVTMAVRPKRNSPWKDSMGFIDPDQIDEDAFEEAERAVEEQLAGVYACLVGLPNPPDPRNIPTAATAAAAATDEGSGEFGIGIGDDEGIGKDEYVVEKDVDQYNDLGIIKSNLNYDDDSVFADEEPPVDMSYYRDTNGMHGQNLTRGGPERPDTS